MQSTLSNPSHSDQIKNLKRIEGQVRGLIRMIEEKRYCIDILTQFKSVKAALTGVETNVLHKHIENCFANALREGSATERSKKVEEVVAIITQMG